MQIDAIICKVMEQEDERQRDRQYDGACGVALRQGWIENNRRMW